MKRLLAFAVAAVVTIGAASVYAGEGCCAGMSKSSAKGAACGEFSKLNLTDAQKAKVEALKEQCNKATSTSERREMMAKGMQNILTPEQLTQCQSSCDKAMKNDKKS